MTAQCHSFACYATLYQTRSYVKNFQFNHFANPGLLGYVNLMRQILRSLKIPVISYWSNLYDFEMILALIIFSLSLQPMVIFALDLDH